MGTSSTLRGAPLDKSRSGSTRGFWMTHLSNDLVTSTEVDDPYSLERR